MTKLIRDADIKDLAAIVEIYNTTIASRTATAETEPITLASRLDWLQNRDFATRPVWVVQIAEQVVGWLSFNNFYGRPAYARTAELSIYVAQSYRRQGIGNLLLQEAIAAAPQLNIQILLGFIFAHNQASLKLFYKHGFERWGFFPQVAELDAQLKDLAILGKKLS